MKKTTTSRGRRLQERSVSDRREKQRFPFDFGNVFFTWEKDKVTYRGVGECKNISSTGLFIACAEPVPKGTALTVIIAWPAILDQTTLMNLKLMGCVIRVDAKYPGMAIVIERYNFTTRAKTGAREDLLQGQIDPKAMASPPMTRLIQ